MPRNLCRDSRFASLFATLVCAWALALVVLGLSGSPRSEAGLASRAAVAAAAGR